MKVAVLHLAGPAYTSKEQPDGYVRRLEAACQLMHEGLRPPQATGAQTASSSPAAHNAPPANPPKPSAAGSIAAGELCTLLLTDQEVLDVVLALHEIRVAQLCHLMPVSGSHALKLPAPGKALAKQLSQSEWSVPGGQLLALVKTLERESSLKVLDLVWGMENTLQGDPLLRVWDSMHRAMLLVLAALQSLPIRPHPQHPGPAATTCNSTTTQLPPGYHRCSACLLLSLRLALRLSQFCIDHRGKADQLFAWLHGTLPGLLLGLSTAMTVMQAAGHPEAQAQRVQFVRCLLHLGPRSAASLKNMDSKASSDSSSRHHGSSRGQASSGGPHGETGRSGASQSPGAKLHALAVNSYVCLAQALWDVLRRQEEAFTLKELITTCQQEGPGSMKELWHDATGFGAMAISVAFQHSIFMHQTLEDAASDASGITARVAAPRHSAAAVSTPLLVSDILTLLARLLPGYQAAVMALKLFATTGIVNESMGTEKKMLEAFLTSLSTMYAALYQAMVKLTQLMPDWRRRPAVLRTGLRIAAVGSLAHSTMVLLLPYMGNPYMDMTTSTPCLTELERKLSYMSWDVTHLWSLVLAQDGVNEPPTGAFFLNVNFLNRLTTDRVAVLPSPSSPQLAPFALDLVLGMENTLQMVMQHQDMVWKRPFWNNGNYVQSLADDYRIMLALFGHVIQVLAAPGVVGPAGLAAQPASWLPCGNSLVEGWCTRLLAGVCKLMCIATPAATTVHVLLKIMLNRRLRGSYKLLLRGQRQAPPSMSPEAERLLSCLTLVLTAMLPQEMCLAMAQGVTPGQDMTLEERRALGVALPKLEEDPRAMGVALSKLQPEQVWTWQALAAGTPAEATLQGLLPALASLFQVQGLVTPIAPGWRHQRLTVALGEWHLS